MRSSRTRRRADRARRLRRSLDEGIECQAVYRDERLALERPGWRWLKKVRGNTNPARNVKEEAFDLLDEARTTAPMAQLVYWCVKAKPGEGDGKKYLWVGYAAVDFYLDGQIVYFGPDGPPFDQDGGGP